MLRIVLLLLALFTAPVRADDWDAARADGAILLMRHATAPGTGDPEGFRIGDCATQRNLSNEGRAQARATGAAIREAGLAITHVLTSQWCRCRDTAQLMSLGPVEEWPSLNSFFEDRTTANAQTAQTLARLSALPAGARPILVTHQVNISALTGVVPGSGEIIVAELRNGALTATGRIAPSQPCSANRAETAGSSTKICK
jgi:phosphohistidine phosphatase SixA